jgi:hypothetical protein
MVYFQKSVPDTDFRFDEADLGCSYIIFKVYLPLSGFHPGGRGFSMTWVLIKVKIQKPQSSQRIHAKIAKS